MVPANDSHRTAGMVGRPSIAGKSEVQLNWPSSGEWIVNATLIIVCPNCALQPAFDILPVIGTLRSREPFKSEPLPRRCHSETGHSSDPCSLRRARNPEHGSEWDVAFPVSERLGGKDDATRRDLQSVPGKLPGDRMSLLLSAQSVRQCD